MAPFSRFHLSCLLALACFLACPGTADAAKKKAAVPLVAPAPKAAETAPAASPASPFSPVSPVSPVSPSTTPAASAPGNPGTSFQELNFNRTLVIEGKVEKPAVQFTLLKEPPPEKEIRFETSFLQNILKLDRENTFKAGETYGRE